MNQKTKKVIEEFVQERMFLAYGIEHEWLPNEDELYLKGVLKTLELLGYEVIQRDGKCMLLKV